MEIENKTILKSGVSDLTNRTYSIECLEQLVKSFNTKYSKGMLGEMSPSTFGVVNLETVSHKIEKVYIEDNNLKCKGYTLNTNCGNILKQLLEDDIVNFTMSSIGTVDNNIVNPDDLQIVSVSVINKT